MRKKIVYIIVDGMADLPIEGKTPLSSAYKPNIDWLAKNGVVGELNLTPKPLHPSTRFSNVAMLGYNPKKFSTERGPLEAVGADIPLQEGHLALRCNFATIDEGGRIIDRRAGRNDYGLDEIVRYINQHVDIGVPFTFLRVYEHRAVLIIKMNLSDQITENDPYVNGEKPKKITGLTKEAMIAAKIIQDFIDKSHDIIKFHPKNGERIEKKIPPANYIIVRGAGNKIQAFPKFLKKWKLKKATVIAEPGVTKAIFMLAGFNSVVIPTELNFEESLDFIFENINDLLPDYQMIVAHIKGPDEPAHDGDFKTKQKMIEAIDKKLETFKDFDGVLVFTTDHITSCGLKAHAHGPVPVLVYGRGKNKVKTFNEFSVKKGKLKKYSGLKLLKFIFSR